MCDKIFETPTHLLLFKSKIQAKKKKEEKTKLNVIMIMINDGNNNDVCQCVNLTKLDH